MKNLIIKSSLFLIFLVNCKNYEKKAIEKQKDDSCHDIETCDILITEKDTIKLRKNIPSNSVLSITSTSNQYTLQTTKCLDGYGWGWSIAYACLEDEKRVISEFKKEYKNIDFDFVLYQSKSDAFFFKVKNGKLFMVAYKYSLIDTKPLFQNEKGETIEIGTKEITKEKLIPLNILVSKTFNTDFICKYRENDKSYPFTITVKNILINERTKTDK